MTETIISTYPDELLRGIPKNTYDNGILRQEAFALDPVREDGYCEVSITWYDEPKAFYLIASQLNDRTGFVQFPDGIAEIKRKDLDERMKPQMIQENLKYERRPTKDNKYHGNILVKNELDKQMKRLIQAQLALLANGCIHPNPYA